MTASTGIYSIWDDHDFGNNDQAGGAGILQTWKLHNFNVFAENWNNPSYPGGGAYPGCFYDFTLGDVHFIMTDGRFYREKGQTMLGPEQQNWLLQTLASSKSTFKVLCSGTLWTEHADNGLDSWAGHRQDRDEIFALIRDAKIPGVFLLSGDRHRHEMFQINFDVGYPLYEFETAKVTGYHSHPSNPFALFSYTKGNFFGMLDFDFSVQDPTVTYRCVTESGKSPQHLTFQTSLAKLTPSR
jgi:alkaline phosphatase D